MGANLPGVEVHRGPGFINGPGWRAGCGVLLDADVLAMNRQSPQRQRTVGRDLKRLPFNWRFGKRRIGPLDLNDADRVRDELASCLLELDEGMDGVVRVERAAPELNAEVNVRVSVRGQSESDWRRGLGSPFVDHVQTYRAADSRRPGVAEFHRHDHGFARRLELSQAARAIAAQRGYGNRRGEAAYVVRGRIGLLGKEKAGRGQQESKREQAAHEKTSRVTSAPWPDVHHQ